MPVSVQESSASLTEAERVRWRSAVAGVLAKSSRKDPADLGAEPDRLLDSPTYDGFPIRPLYTALDGLPEAPLPGQWPFVRGGDALRDVKAGWKVAEEFPVKRGGEAASVAEGNGAVLAALTEGTSALVLRVGPGAIAATELDRWLEGVFLELVPVIVDVRAAGAEFVTAGRRKDAARHRLRADVVTNSCGLRHGGRHRPCLEPPRPAGARSTPA